MSCINIYIYIYGTALGGPPPLWRGTLGSMLRGGFFRHKILIKHQDLAPKNGRHDMVMLITRKTDDNVKWWLQ